MADKEATIYIVDLGQSMGETHNERNETDLEYAMRYVWDKITTTVATERKTAMAGVIGFRTDETNNPLEDSEGYDNLRVLQPISQILLPDLNRLREVVKPSTTEVEGDGISAIILAIQMIIQQCKKLKYIRKIVLVTNGRGPMDTSMLEEIVKKIQADNIELVVLGVDFDDAEYGFKEESKPKQKARNETLLRQLVEDCSGVFGTLKEAVDELGMPRIKSTRPIASYKGKLSLGDYRNYKTAISIDVERYPKVVVRKPPSASSYVLHSNSNGDQGSPSSSTTVQADQDPSRGPGTNLTNVRSAYTYQVVNDGVIDGKRDVDREELAKGYEYGRTAVHISESDENITKLESEAGLDIIGYILKDKYQRYMTLSQSNVIIAQKTNQESLLAMSSLVHTLYELDIYAVARFVQRDGKDPMLILLAPLIEPDLECLVELQLPFAEDIRSYQFPPLDKIITVSGKEVTQHRNLPNDDLLDAMGSYVDRMDLSMLDADDEGQGEQFVLVDAFSPLYHRIDQAIRWRATHPKDEVQPPSEVIMRYSKPPDALQVQCEKGVRILIKAANVKKVPPKAKGRKRNRDADKPLSGLDVEGLFHRDKRAKISSNNARPEFKQALESADQEDVIKDLVSQMSQIIQEKITNSYADRDYDIALELLGTLREEMKDYEYPELYNDVVQDLKTKLLAEELGGPRKDMWNEVRKHRLGLIEKRVSEQSKVTEEDARKFLGK